LQQAIFIDDVPKILAALENAPQTGSYSVEFRVRHPNGSLHWIAAKGRIDHSPALLRGAIFDITERKAAQARHDMLTGEIQHRTKNLFAVVQAVVARSFAGKKTVDEAQAAVLSRLSSLAQTHLLLMDQQWEGAELTEIVNSEMKPYADRVFAEGPRLVLSAKAAQNFALAIHELATNAAKYGALSTPAGRVYISWSIAELNGSGQFTFRWRERGGPVVSSPTQKGFGSTVLEQVMAEYFDEPPRIDFAGGGVSYELSGSLDSISEQAAAS
jgi:two-component sensor histidine kinase